MKKTKSSSQATGIYVKIINIMPCNILKNLELLKQFAHITANW